MLAPDLGGTHLGAAVVDTDAVSTVRRRARIPMDPGMVAVVSGLDPLTGSFGALPLVASGI